MYGDEQAFLRWLDSLRQRFGSDRVDDLHAGIVTLLARMGRRHDQDQRDIEAARLLPLGASVAAEAQGVCRATAYNRAARGVKKLSNENSMDRHEAA